MQLHPEPSGAHDEDTGGRLHEPLTDSAPRIPGEPGIWIFILGDMLVFAVLFGLFLHDRAQAPELFMSSQELLYQPYGAINTLLLLTSSVGVVFAIRAIRDANKTKASILFALAMACGLAFCGVKVVEYGEKISAGIVPTSNDFWMYYYVLTAIHLFHLVLGLLLLGFCLLQSRRDHLSKQRYQLVEGIGCFWHMVDLLWIVLFPLLYLVR